MAVPDTVPAISLGKQGELNGEVNLVVEDSGIWKRWVADKLSGSQFWPKNTKTAKLHTIVPWNPLDSGRDWGWRMGEEAISNPE